MASADVRYPIPIVSGRGQATVGDDLTVVKQDQLIRSDPVAYKRRRTIAIERALGGSCGFTLQSYGLHHKKTQQTELLTYVDYVELGGPAHLAGLRPGDVILSVNGVSMEKADHNTLVSCIRNSGNVLRMVVLFDDCCHKIELRFRQIRLQQLLAEKIRQLKLLEMKELLMMKGVSQRYSKDEDDEDDNDSASSSDSSTSSRCSSPQVVDLESSFNSPEGADSSYSPEGAGQSLLASQSQDSPMIPVSHDFNSLPADVRHHKYHHQQQQPSAQADPYKMSHSMDDGSMKAQMHVSQPGVRHRNSRSLSEICDRQKTAAPVSQTRNTLPQQQCSADSRRRQRRVSQHVVIAESSEPHLVSLRRFCDEYRTSCLRQNLIARRCSLDRMLSSHLTSDDFQTLLSNVAEERASAATERRLTIH